MVWSWQLDEKLPDKMDFVRQAFNRMGVSRSTADQRKEIRENETKKKLATNAVDFVFELLAKITKSLEI